MPQAAATVSTSASSIALYVIYDAKMEQKMLQEAATASTSASSMAYNRINFSSINI